MRRRGTDSILRAAVLLLCSCALASPALAGTPQAAASGESKLDKALAKAARLGVGDSRVIIELEDGANAALVVKGLSGKLGRQLHTFKGTAATVPSSQLEMLARHPLVKHVYLDRPTGGELNRTAVVVGARAVQDLMGFAGTGVGVAVIDSGITSWHDDLSGTGLNGEKIAAFVDFVGGQAAPYDDNGHGTHVAGIIAGSGYDSYGARAGIAPGAHLIGLKVLDARGAGRISDVIAALDWVVAHKRDYNIRVINLSVGASVTSSYLTDPLTLAARAVTQAGVVLVVAAGNLGKNAAGNLQYGGITAPGNAPWVLTVGASSHMGTLTRLDDQVASYSSRGPAFIDFEAKPDIVAPGTGIVSLSDPASTMYGTKASFLVSGWRATSYKPYLSLSGTSMASPVVAGTVALMLQANPALTPNAVKAILQYTAQTYPGYDALTQGAGFLNTRGAVQLARFFRTALPGARFPSSGAWSRHVIWGNHRVGGGMILPAANAWATNVVWGAARDESGDNIVWGNACPAADADCENIVWGNSELGENVVWGNEAPLDDIVWGNSVDNVVWGAMVDPETDNIIWGNAADAENIVWGNDCDGANCENVVWGASVESLDGDNIVWGNSESADNIVWGQSGDLENVVWGTSSEEDNVTWGNSAFDGVVFEEPSIEDVALADPTVWESLFERPGAVSPAEAPPPDASTVTTITSLTSTGITGGGF